MRQRVRKWIFETSSRCTWSCFLIAAFVFSGCATSRVTEPVENGRPSSATARSPDSQVSIQEILAADAEIEPGPHSGVPIEINANVEKWIDYFSLKDRTRFRTFLERGLAYKPLVREILKEHGVPSELYYLAMIESGYVTHARSRARAVGAWQFIRATGKRYGLTASHDLDERRDIVRSTRAAARFLKDLHDEFGSWYLALAAYNAGEGRIRGAIRRGKSNDFWVLVGKRKLPRETMNYVPKFLAAVIIGRNPEKYGFENLKAETFPKLEKAKVPGRVHLKEISARAGLQYEEMKEINPHLIRQTTPRNVSGYEIWVPEGKAEAVEALKKEYVTFRSPEKKPVLRRHASVKHRAVPRTHRVRRGETLIAIAQRYRIQVSDLKRLNRLRSNRIFFGQKLKVASNRAGAKGLNSL
ncbi:MAG TPA: transglycosylase SLT domain-containing protein [Bdellovibrionota bacterium]|nr:transglycosylase SLT domain-containing protein [Bdellovibrionota bacterium]